MKETSVLAVSAVAALALFVFARARTSEPREAALSDHCASTSSADSARFELAVTLEPEGPGSRIELGVKAPVAALSGAVQDDGARSDGGFFTVTGEVIEMTPFENEREGFTDYTETPLIPSGIGRVRFIPRGVTRGREVIERVISAGLPLTFAAVPRGEWEVEVFEPGFGPRWYSYSTLNEERPEFHARLQRAPALELDVRLPDGTQPTHAFLTFVSRRYSDEWLLTPRTAANHSLRMLQLRTRDHPFHHWTPDDPRTGWITHDDGALLDVIVIAVPHGHDPFDARAPCRFTSSIVRVEPDHASPLRVELEEVACVAIEIQAPETLVLEARPWVRAIRRIVVDGIDVADQFAVDAPIDQSLYGHAEFDDYFSGAISREFDSKTLARYLTPGSWRFIGGWDDRGRWGTPVVTVTQDDTVTQDVEVALGWNQVTLTFGQPATDHLLPVRFVVEGHDVVVPPQMGDWFGACVLEPLRILDQSTSSLRGASGERWIPRGELAKLLAIAPDARLLCRAPFGDGPGRSDVVLLSEPLRAEMQAITFSKARVAQVALGLQSEAAGVRELTYEAALIDPQGEATDWRAETGMTDRQKESGSVRFGPGRQVEPLFELLPLGRWRVDFRVVGAPLLRIEPRETELRAGLQELEVRVPELFEVSVHAPHLRSGERLRLFPKDAALGNEPSQIEPDRVELDADRRAVFSGVPAGRYVISHGVRSPPLDIDVPCGEILYEARPTDAYELRLTPLENGADGTLARAGFKSGDVVLAYDLRQLRDDLDVMALHDVIEQRTTILRVRRGAELLELPLGPMPDPDDPWATFDAEFVPTWL